MCVFPLCDDSRRSLQEVTGDVPHVVGETKLKYGSVTGVNVENDGHG